MSNWKELSAAGGLSQTAIRFSPTNYTNYTNWVFHGTGGAKKNELNIFVSHDLCHGRSYGTIGNQNRQQVQNKAGRAVYAAPAQVRHKPKISVICVIRWQTQCRRKPAPDLRNKSFQVTFRLSGRKRPERRNPFPPFHLSSKIPIT